MHKIIVTDDDPISRELMRHILKKNNFDVQVAKGGNECIEMVRENAPALILLDFYMDDLDGLDVVRILRVHHGYTGGIIMCTASAEKQNVQRLIEAGIHGYLLKPMNPTKLLSTVNRVLGLPDSPESYLK
jgi:CheY-like chemotaxis protein